MKLSQRLQDERAFVERSLGDAVICRNCGATLMTYAEACTADLQELCPGFLAIEQAKKDFAAFAAAPEATHPPYCDCDDCCTREPGSTAKPMRLPSWDELNLEREAKP